MNREFGLDIIIISEFCEDFSKSDNDRFFYIARTLAETNEVELITSSFRHTTKSKRNNSADKWPFKITFIDEPGYRKNICFKRFQSHSIWGKNVEKYIKARKQPNIIYCAVPSLTAPGLIAKYCEKNNIRFVIDVQDLWPEAFQMIVNIPVLSYVGFIPFKLLADNIYKRADAICAVSETYCKRALKINKKCKKGITVFLGTELTAFDKYAGEKPVLDKAEGEVWLAYCGTLGASYDLTCVIDALDILKNNSVRLVVMGNGPKEKEFEAYAEKKGVKTIFVGRVKYNQMCSLLSICDIAVNPIVHMAAQSIINKHADYAASGLPVVSTQESQEYQELIREYKMGFNCRNNDAVDLAKKLKKLIDNKQLRIEMGYNARRCAEERFDRKKTYKLLVDEICAD